MFGRTVVATEHISRHGLNGLSGRRGISSLSSRHGLSSLSSRRGLKHDSNTFSKTKSRDKKRVGYIEYCLYVCHLAMIVIAYSIPFDSIIVGPFAFVTKSRVLIKPNP